MLKLMDFDELKTAYLFALEKGITQEAIAKHSGVPVASLRKFKQGEPLGREKRKQLEQWLKSNNYYDWSKLSDPAILLAKELRILADVLESTLDRETKRKRFAALIDAYGSGVHIPIPEESSDND